MTVITQLCKTCRSAPTLGARRAAGFTLIDILVSMAVIALLIGLLLPSFRGVREATRKVICASNVRQIGMGIMVYAQENKDLVPFSRFAPTPTNSASAKPGLMMKLRIVTPNEHFDGLGRLFSGDYLNAPGIFYCPSHQGEHRFENYAEQWASLSGQIYGNFQYRGASPTGDPRLGGNPSNRFALVTDGLTQLDYNHQVGSNVLLADMSLSWFEDLSKRFYQQLPVKDVDVQADEKVRDAWIELDQKVSNIVPPAP